MSQISCHSVATSTSVWVKEQAVDVLTWCKKKKKALTECISVLDAWCYLLAIVKEYFPDLMGVKR